MNNTQARILLTQADNLVRAVQEITIAVVRDEDDEALHDLAVALYAARTALLRIKEEGRYK